MKIFLLVVMTLFCFSLMGAYQYTNLVQINDKTLSVMKTTGLVLEFKTPIDKWSKFLVETVKKDGSTILKTIDINGKSIDIGKVSSGDDLKFYLVNDKGDLAKSNLTFWGSGWDSKYDTYEYVHFGENYGKNDHNYVIQKFKIDEKVPVGQPLPGVLVSLFVGGSGLWFMKKAKKINKNT